MDSDRGKSDVQELVSCLLPFAENMLREHKEFLPFGAHTKLDGTIVWEGASDGREQPPSQALLDILHGAHKRMALAQEIVACATIYDVRATPPGRSEKQDAIAAALDHVRGYSGVVMFPYYFDSQDELCVESPFAMVGDAAIFPAFA